MILITGAAGKTGKAIVQSLVARHKRIRALVRRKEQEKTLKQLGAEETVIGDIGDQATLEEAADGVKAIYHICPNMHPQELSIGRVVIRVAQTLGVEHFVYHSVLQPQIEAMPHHWQKLRVEEQLLESGLAFTILQPAAYMQNVLAYWDRVLHKGIYAVPYGLSTRLSMVDLQDVAEAAAVVLTESGHEFATYELCGPEILSQREVAATWGEQLGREVTAKTVAIEKWEKQARSTGLDDYARQTLMEMFQYYDRNDFCGNSRVLGWLLGRPPLNFAQFLQRAIHEYGAI